MSLRFRPREEVSRTSNARVRKEEIVRDIALIFLVGVAFRFCLLILFPVPYGNDGMGRIYFKEQIFLSHWLPLTQILVYGLAKMGGHMMSVRAAFACLGAIASGGFYLFLRLFATRRQAVFGGFLFSLNAFYVILSLMPYQDVLFLGLFYSALALLFHDETPLTSWWGSLFFGLACLTRYESWFILPFLIIWKTRREWDAGSVVRLGRKLAEASLYFGWAPVFWLILSASKWGSIDGFLHQTADQEFYAWNPHLDLEWIASYAVRMAYWLALFGSPLVLFSLAGLARALRGRRHLHDGLRLLLLFGGLVLVFFFFVIGKSQDSVNRFAMIPLSILLVFTVLGIDAALTWVRSGRLRALGFLVPQRDRFLIPVSLTLLAMYSSIPIARLNARPEFSDPYDVARYLDAALRNGETALVVAKRFPDLSDAAPMAYQRVITQSRFDRDRILCADLLDLKTREAILECARRRRVRFVALFHDFTPTNPADSLLTEYVLAQDGDARAVLRTTSVTLYEIREWRP